MKPWRRKTGGLVVFLIIALLVAGGLGWVTAAALHLEQDQMDNRHQADEYENLRLALWKLDSRISPILAREDSRPYNHFSAIYAPSLPLENNGQPLAPGTVLEPSPLLNGDLPEWILLHFQADEESGWESPQVVSTSLARLLAPAETTGRLVKADPDQAKKRILVLKDLASQVSPKTLLASVQERGLQLTQEEVTLVPSKLNKEPNQSQSLQQQVAFGDGYLDRRSQQSRSMNDVHNSPSQHDDSSVVSNNFKSNGQGWFTQNAIRPAPSEEVSINLSPMVPFWLKEPNGKDQLVVARLVQVGNKKVCQGMVLDWLKLQTLLAKEAEPLFPGAFVEPVIAEVPPHPDRTMTALPVQLDLAPGETVPQVSGWTPLRVGLVSAWVAALVALLAVGLGGWSLLSLSERRIRFVYAVTHELRTPLTTLRLYLDMLTTGMVKEERQKGEYLQILNAEADRLNRLVANVLHYSRLENQRPRLNRASVMVGDLLEQVRETWQGRCLDAGKELIVENTTSKDAKLLTDGELVQQILGNLIDNGCKYSQGSEDRRLWVRAFQSRPGRLALEVEDRGPGIPASEQRVIFRSFRRGRNAEVIAGGVGLGLALARRWSKLLNGSLSVGSGPDGKGACFRVEFPLMKGVSTP